MDFQLVRREIMNKLFIIKSEKEINLLKENGIDNFVYPLFSFCVGVENEFSLSEIKEENSYLFVSLTHRNRIHFVSLIAKLIKTNKIKQ